MRQILIALRGGRGAVLLEFVEQRRRLERAERVRLLVKNGQLGNVEAKSELEYEDPLEHVGAAQQRRRGIPLALAELRVGDEAELELASGVECAGRGCHRDRCRRARRAFQQLANLIRQGARGVAPAVDDRYGQT